MYDNYKAVLLVLFSCQFVFIIIMIVALIYVM